jgi:hypothetical protein
MATNTKMFLGHWDQRRVAMLASGGEHCLVSK